jgi:DNA-binding MarR family transcriptional regulator
MSGKKPDKTNLAVDLGELPDLLGYQLRRAQLAAFQNFAARIDMEGITPARFGLLTIVEHNRGLSQTALAQALGTDRSSMVAMIDRLEAEGYVERRRAPGDRRSHAIHPTHAGTALLEKIRPLIRAHEAEIAKGLGAGERAALLRLLRRISGV